ncbi:flagellar hook-associated protein FlgK [Sphingomonas sp. CJ20]
MSDMLSIGASGVRAYQTALSTTSENIANAGTAGYARRTTGVRELTATTGSLNATVNGMGAVATGVVRSDDAYRSANVRTASADLAKTETSATWLGRIETALTGAKLGDSITRFFTSATTLSADATSLSSRAAMLEAASGAASAFATTGKALDGAMADLDSTAQAAVSQLNTLTAALAKVNSGLGRAAPGTSGAAALLDQRDQLLEQMSALTDVSVTLDTSGRATVQGGGGVLVDSTGAATITYARNGGATAFTLTKDGEAHALSATGGAIAGVAEGAQRIQAAQDALSDLARDFAEGVNTVQAGGQDLDGQTGAPIFAIGDPAAQLSVTLTDPRGIAAAAPGGGTRDNSNLKALDTLRTTGKVETGVSDLTAANASALAARKSVAEAQSVIRDGAVSARDSVTGVNIDEEAVDLMRFQQAYQASSRVIQIARDTLQSILDIR